MDMNQDLNDEFLAEAREHIDIMEEELLILEKTGSDSDPERIASLFRSIHSIKGAAGFLGFVKINDLTHVMETLLQMMRSEEIKPEPVFIDALLSGIDVLSSLLDNLGGSNDMDIQGIHDRLSSLIGKATSPEMKKEMEKDVALTDGHGDDIGFKINEYTLKNIPATHEYIYVLKYNLFDTQKTEGLSPVALIKKLLSTGLIVDAKLDSPAEDLSQDLSGASLFYHVLYATLLDDDLIGPASGLPEAQIVTVSREKSPPAGETAAAAAPETESLPASEKALHPDARIPEKTGRVKTGSDNHNETIRINVDIINQLMTLTSEMVLGRNQLIEAVSNGDRKKREDVTQKINILTSELQEVVMRTRMQPIGNVFAKLPRIVRDLSRKLDKKIDITITGNEVELDKTILESLADPLTHLIRNCCDHAVEPPEERTAAGKPETGNVLVEAAHEAGQIIIKIKDDGKGIDPAIIGDKAVEKGIRTREELMEMSEKDVLSLIMSSGFSTAEKISDVSGRGVGMDVVETSIQHLGGTLDLTSAVGLGTTFEIRLPLTLAIIPSLVVMVGGYRYAIPQVNLEELVCLYDEDATRKIESADNQEIYRLREHLLPMVRLEEVLHRSTPFDFRDRSEIAEKWKNEKECKSLTFAVVKIGARRFGLIVDKVIGTEEIVVKPMHSALKNLSIYSGATVMGDGKVALILDIEGIAGHADVQFKAAEKVQQDAAESVTGTEELQTVLLFRSGIREQFAVPLPLIRRIERISTSEIENIGGKEYITIDGESTLIIRLDNVLNVSRSENRDEAFLLLPKHINRSVGILMSSVIDTTETAGNLSTDAYMEEGLLGTAIVRNQMTLFLEIYHLIEKAEPEWFGRAKKKESAEKAAKQILLAEDTPFFQHLVKDYLESAGYRVSVAENGKRAMQLISDNRFDLIVSDIEMPLMDGLSLIRGIRRNKDFEKIPAIALTALSSESDRKKALDAGFNKYQVKINREALLDIVDTMIG